MTAEAPRPLAWANRRSRGKDGAAGIAGRLSIAWSIVRSYGTGSELDGFPSLVGLGPVRVGEHYQGAAGKSYYAWQERVATDGVSLAVKKYAPYVSPDSTVLDFGCGGGFILAALRAREKIGIEPAPAPREAASQHGFRVVADPSELPDRCADVVISNHALEHTPSPLESLGELHRLLKPDGKIVIRLPLDDWRRQRRYDAGDINHHLYTWTPLSFGHLLHDAGFTSINIEMITRAWPPYLKLLSRLPPKTFDRISWAYAVASRLRELSAVATK